MKWLGLTGGISTGKSTVAVLMRDIHGIPFICADRLARDAVQIGTPALVQIAKEFGQEVLGPDGSLDRKALGKKVFGFPDKLLRLEEIVHPQVRRLQTEQRDSLGLDGEPLAVYDVPLLFEKNLQVDYDAIIVVACRADVQLARLMKRDGVSEVEAKKRIDSQLPIDQKIKLANFVIRNDAGLDELRIEVDKAVAKIRTHFSL